MVITAIIASAITSTADHINMSIVIAPMILLYFINIGLNQMAITSHRIKEPEPTSITSQL